MFSNHVQLCDFRAILLYTELEWRAALQQLISYLLDNLILDFQGDLSLDLVRQLLKDDKSESAKILMTRLVEDRGVSEMMICLADCLKDHLSTGITPEVINDQLQLYSES